jgi:cardiolipin synthase
LRQVLQTRRHRLDRLAGLRYHHKLVLSLLVVFGILLLVVLLAKDRENIKLESAYGASDARFPAYIAALAGAAPTSGNRFDVLQNGDVFFPAMLDAIVRARRRIDFETYIYEKGIAGDRFTAALEAAARRRVDVNLVVDAVGSKQMSSDDATRLRAAGVRLGTFGAPRWFKLQEINYRTHRKLLVIDGAVAFTGGAGVADQWLGNAQDSDHWRDMMVRIDGPLARLLEGAFNASFVSTVAPVEPRVTPASIALDVASHDSAFVIRSAATGGSNDMKRVYMLAIAAARRTLDITSPYFLMDASSKWALAQAAARGVRVRILVEGDDTDARIVKYASREEYRRLMAEGIAIYEYQSTMMHTKSLVVDGTWSMFGSANFDNRSLELNDELNVAVSDADLAARLTSAFDRDLQRARKLDLVSWRRRPALEKGREFFWSYFSEVF